MRMIGNPALRVAVTAAVVGTLVTTGIAAAATGSPIGRNDRPPDEAAVLRNESALCRADSPNFRVWWSDAPTGAGALVGADGNCASLPPAAQGILDTAEATRTVVAARGFPPLVGDAPPRIPRSTQAFNQLRRLRPAQRARVLAGLRPELRARLLAGFSVNQRRVVLRGLSRSQRLRLTRDATRGGLGRPSDFVGGDRRLDLILDRTGVTGEVGTSRPGSARCSYFQLPTGRRFAGSAIVLLTPDANVPRGTLAHELFHAAQCMLGASGDLVMMEGTAEWFGALAEPADFVGQVTVTGASGGVTRAISFCREFNPNRPPPPLDVYDSWAVWTALEAGAPGTVAQVLRSAAASPLGSSQAVLAATGDAQWSAALLVAVREVCGNLRSPSGLTTFPPETRGFFVDPTRPVARVGAPATAVTPAGGTTTLVADWSATPPTTQVVVRLTAAGLAPDALATRLVAQSGGVVLPVTSDPTGALVTLPAAQASALRALVTVASPTISAPLSVVAEVVVT